MRITQGTFSFLPDLSDGEIDAQVRYALANGWAISVEHTDDPHPRNSYWEMWGMPMFDLPPTESGAVMRELAACRDRFPNRYVMVTAYDARYGRQTTALRFVVNRPPDEPGFRLERADRRDRTIDYRLHAFATDAPAGRRYGAAERRS